LTPVERSQTTAQLAEATAEQLRGRAQTQAPQGSAPNPAEDVDTPTPASPGPESKTSPGVEKPKRPGGRQKMPDSQVNVAAEMVVAEMTLSDAQRYLAAVKRYPELGAPGVSRSEAIAR
jgi:hypothetical protein